MIELLEAVFNSPAVHTEFLAICQLQVKFFYPGSFGGFYSVVFSVSVCLYLQFGGSSLCSDLNSLIKKNMLIVSLFSFDFVRTYMSNQKQKVLTAFLYLHYSTYHPLLQTFIFRICLLQ